MNTNAINRALFDAFSGHCPSNGVSPRKLAPTDVDTEAARRRVVAHLRTQSPDLAAQFDTASRAADLPAALSGHALMASLDLSVPVDVLAAYWTTAWSIAHRRPPEAGRYAAVARRLRACAALEAALWRNDGGALRAYVAELQFQTVLLLELAGAGAGRDDGLPQSLVDRIRATARAEGVDLEDLHEAPDGGLQRAPFQIDGTARLM
ncbi:MAG: hypothetical protein ACXIUZ_06150 [Lysobacteraceae bacterium]